MIDALKPRIHLPFCEGRASFHPGISLIERVASWQILFDDCGQIGLDAFKDCK